MLKIHKINDEYAICFDSDNWLIIVKRNQITYLPGHRPFFVECNRITEGRMDEPLDRSDPSSLSLKELINDLLRANPADADIQDLDIAIAYFWLDKLNASQEQQEQTV